MRRDARALMLAAGMLLACGCSHAQDNICIGKACYSVEVMRTDEERTRGLMFRRELAEGLGMLFVFDQEDIYPFWMKNMSFPIDILWLDKAQRVVFIETDAPPCHSETCPVYTPSKKAMYVLEVPAGTVARNGIRAGDAARR